MLYIPYINNCKNIDLFLATLHVKVYTDTKSKLFTAVDCANLMDII